MDFDKAYALLIGVGGNDIPQSARDAESLHSVLIDPEIGGYPPDNVMTLVNADATRKNCLDHLKRLAELSKRQKDKTYFIYYSGHGGQYDMRDKEGVYTEFYLKMHGYDETDKPGTMINGDEFADIINTMRAERIVVMLDCCHASGMNDDDNVFEAKKNERQQPNTGSRNASRPLIDKLNNGAGRIFISSCKDEEKSLILRGSKNSLFTEALIEAIYGLNTGEYPYVHVMDLAAYLIRKVPERSSVKRSASPNAPAFPRQNPVIDEVKGLDSYFFICRNSTFGSTPADPVEIKGQFVKKDGEAMLSIDEKYRQVTDLINETIDILVEDEKTGNKLKQLVGRASDWIKGLF